MYYRNDPSEYSLDFCYSALPLYTSDNQLGACGLHIMNIIMNPPPPPPPPIWSYEHLFINTFIHPVVICPAIQVLHV